MVASLVPLKRYGKPGSILKIEDINYAVDAKSMEPLCCFAISSKRYALFNLDVDGRPILRKASAHGLGHLIDPYADDQAPSHLPKPRVPLSQMGVRRQQHDLWMSIVRAALDGKPERVALDWHAAFESPAASRYGASSPQLIRWLDAWNADKNYQDQVRPFGFLLSYTARSGVFAPCEESDAISSVKLGRTCKDRVPKQRTRSVSAGRKI